MITVTVLFFAHYQDIAGSRQQQHTLPNGATVSNLAQHLQSIYPAFSDILAYGRAAISHEFVLPSAVLHDGDEVAFMPPMSGG